MAKTLIGDANGHLNACVLKHLTGTDRDICSHLYPTASLGCCHWRCYCINRKRSKGIELGRRVRIGRRLRKRRSWFSFIVVLTNFWGGRLLSLSPIPAFRNEGPLSLSQANTDPIIQGNPQICRSAGHSESGQNIDTIILCTIRTVLCRPDESGLEVLRRMDVALIWPHIEARRFAHPWCTSKTGWTVRLMIARAMFEPASQWLKR
jgi:hypothetical protein